ncbi:Na+/H+ antiporter NhaA [Anaeromyxobacter dehalogenans 2CP-1]|uniref:Na+/H+ antiporter NhaA n=1 Tax=Anaeromyxobacter dehalogenans (strain ATCC BAA-258 / DSM 21875 / 2CP-1) TaxID=455488 RepID=B8JHD4_ANAD2|nr:Na+/H+ antiporter NhaA [Anaeromyxobacter dehalogenans]ACL66646.1 Na+/H+ antiporter NhaA [Anaeromyxobacter dehalogenans 2CP-1]
MSASAPLPVRLDPPVDPARDHVLGEAGAELTLVEYGSSACPHCHAAHAVVADLRDRLRYVFRQRPSAPRRPGRRPSWPRRPGSPVTASGGRPPPRLLLLAATALAVAIASSPARAAFTAAWQAPLGLSLGGHAFALPLVQWVNDLVAIAVVALFDSGAISVPWLLAAAAVTAPLAGLSRAAISAAPPYAALGVLLWACLHAAGLHPRLAGVILAVVTPTRPPPDLRALTGQAQAVLEAELRRAREGVLRHRSLPALRALDAIHDRIESPRRRSRSSPRRCSPASSARWCSGPALARGGGGGTPGARGLRGGRGGHVARQGRSGACGGRV